MIGVLYDSLRRKSVLWDVNDRRAFGPVFDGETAGDFLEWFTQQDDTPALRDVSDTTIEIWVEHWRRHEFESEHPWPATYTGRAA